MFRDPRSCSCHQATYAPDPSRGVLIVDWPLFGELSRALALKVARTYEPDLVVGIATAGVVPGAAIAAILDRPVLFDSREPPLQRRAHSRHARRVRRRAAGSARQARAHRGRDLRVRRHAAAGGGALVNAGAKEVRTAVSFKTGSYEPDYHGLATESSIILPWDREILVGQDLIPNPKYAGLLPE
jgi:uncharacterized protein